MGCSARRSPSFKSATRSLSAGNAPVDMENHPGKLWESLPSSSEYICSLLHVLELVRSASGLSIVDVGWGQDECTVKHDCPRVASRVTRRCGWFVRGLRACLVAVFVWSVLRSSGSWIDDRELQSSGWTSEGSFPC